MAAGIQVDKPTINNIVGANSRNIHQLFFGVDGIKAYLDATLDSDLVAMGFTAGEVSVMKSAYADLAQLVAIYRGTANLAAAKNFQTFAKQLHGILT